MRADRRKANIVAKKLSTIVLSSGHPDVKATRLQFVVQGKVWIDIAV